MYNILVRQHEINMLSGKIFKWILRKQGQGPHNRTNKHGNEYSPFITGKDLLDNLTIWRALVHS
jgi:hypothetical protein